MTTDPVKICSQCGAEYDLSALMCADCGGKLVFRESERLLEPLSEAEAQVLVREGAIDYLRELERELAKERIRSAIVFHAQGPGT